MEQLQQWLKDKCAERNLSWREASIGAGLNPGAVSAILKGQRPGLDSCKALAKFFHVSPILLLQLAGHIEKPTLNHPALHDPRFSYLAEMWQLLPDYAQDHLQRQVQLMEKLNPDLRRAMAERGWDLPDVDGK